MFSMDLYRLLSPIFILQLTTVYCLFEDQIGKFDWRIENIGEIRQAVYDTAPKSGKQVIAASKENVIAGLSLSTGKISWRHVMEDSSELYDMVKAGTDGVITVSSNKIRRWTTQGGALSWEVSLTKPTSKDGFKLMDNELVVANSQKVTAYGVKNGAESWSVDAPWQEYENIYVSSSEDTVYVTVSSGDKLTSYIVRDEIIKEISSRVVTKYSTCVAGGAWLACYNSGSRSVEHLLITGDKSVFSQLPQQTEYASQPTLQFIDTDSLVMKTEESSTVYKLSNTGASLLVTAKGVMAKVKSSATESILMSLNSQVQKSKTVIEITAYSMETGDELPKYKQAIDTSNTARPVMMVPYLYNKVGGDVSYRVLSVFSDQTMFMLQQAGKVMWTREEALSAITSLEMVDLPVSEVEAKMEEEFGAKKRSDIFSQFVSRLISQCEQLTSFLIHSYQKHVSGLRVVMETADHMSIDEDYLTRDDFSLHKMIIAMTSVGKIYGLDSYTGQVVWSRYVPELEPFSSGNRLLMYIQRSTAHLPHQPYTTVIAQKNCDGCGSVIFSFNPLTGEPITARPLTLNYRIDQAMMLPQMTDGDFLKPLLLLDTHRQVHVYPEDSVVEGNQEMYVFSAQADSGQIVGLRLSGNTLQSMEAVPTWSLSLHNPIVSLKTKQYREHVHSLGRVLADRAVLYKYVNPNLVAIITESEPDTDHVALNVYLLDGVTGRVIFSCEHRRSSQPVHMVHSENWIVYTYYNQKARRTEIAVLELYEGSTQANATAFSSLHSYKNPVVMRQAYILGTKISALSTSLTERGISGKNILMARTVGGIVEVPKMFVDPRRLLEHTQASKEEGVPPYMPELPLSFEGTLNYNQSVYRIREIHCEPSGLESTSLLVAYGLDVFYTRVAPSKMYDVLKDDFDYLFIGAVTIGMIAVSFISRHFALKKMVTRAWR